MSAAQSPSPGSVPGLHVATIAHEGLLWDAYLEFEPDPGRPRSYRGRIRFDRAGGSGVSTQTTVIIIEESHEEAVARARGLDERQLQGLLRSALPEPEKDGA